MAFPYATKEAYELSGIAQEIDEARLQQYKTAGKYVGDGDCAICAADYFVGNVRPILLHNDGSETLHMICEDCHATQYNDDEEKHNECPYCRLKLFLLPGQNTDYDDDVVRNMTPEDHVRLMHFRIEQIQRGDVHENADLLDDKILSSDLRSIGRHHRQDGDLWWHNIIHQIDEQALRTVLEHRAAVYMDGELDSSLSRYDAAYHHGAEAQMVRMLGNPLNGTYTREHNLDVDEISNTMRDGYYRRFLGANVNGSRGMVTHPLAMQALLVIETTLRNERQHSQYHHPSAIYETLCAETRKMRKRAHKFCEPDIECEHEDENLVLGLETVITDMIAAVINILRTGAYREVTRRSAAGDRRESKRRWRRNHKVSPSR